MTDVADDPTLRPQPLRSSPRHHGLILMSC
ncbi:MAG: hypothetical protein RLZZ584_387 [Pseudomonadota bacterium]|jgi:hypothetical protein